MVDSTTIGAKKQNAVDIAYFSSLREAVFAAETSSRADSVTYDSPGTRDSNIPT